MSDDVFLPATTAELSRFLTDNARGPQRTIQPAGGRTGLRFGFPVAAGVTVSTASLNTIVDYPARDMTITVGAGVRVDDLAETLRAENQQLPVDLPQSQRATAGGAVSTNASGPRRFGYGTLRDYVIGVEAVDASGRTFHAGGRVVKNVAGYDLCKLLVGSLGTLAVVTQLTFKLKPLPETTAGLWIEFDDIALLDAALERINGSAARPVVVDALNAAGAGQLVADARLELPTERPALAVVVEGAEVDVAWQLDRLQDELTRLQPTGIDGLNAEATGRLLRGLREFQVGSDDPLTFKANLPPARTVEFIDRCTDAGIAVRAHAGNGIAVGHLPDDATNATQARQLLDPLTAFAGESHGTLTILECPDEWKQTIPVFGRRPQSWMLHARVKGQLDPHDLLNPGRIRWTPEEPPGDPHGAFDPPSATRNPQSP